MDDNFYITLVSTASSTLYPDNDCANFVTKLYKRLDISDDWEVGVTEIFLPETVCNIANGTCTLWIYYGGQLRHRAILDDLYIPSPTLLVEELNRHVNNLYKFTINDKGLVICKPDEDMKDYVSIRFSPDLSKHLGFQHHQGYLTGTITAYTSANLIHGLSRQLCVCSNIVKAQVFGDSTLNVLRCITVDIKQYIYGACMNYTFPKVIYVPLSMTDIEKISINI